MGDEIPVIARYPVGDVMAFVMLALFTWFFGLLGSFPSIIMAAKGVAYALSQGVLMAYSFHALSRVSGGNFKDVMPDTGDMASLVAPLRLGLATLIISSGPLALVTLTHPEAIFFGGGAGGLSSFSADAAHAQEPPQLPPEPPPEGQEPPAEAQAPPESPEPEEHRPATPQEAGDLESPAKTGLSAAVVLLLILTFLWKLVYTPVALTVAGLSRSFWQTLNPLVGIGAMQRMGSIYWQALAIYTVVAGAQTLLGFVLGFIPFVGSLVRSFVDAYAYLAIGCTLGLAVFKRAPELGLE